MGDGSDDRVAVPVNGHQRVEAAADPTRAAPEPPLELVDEPELRVAFTPAQLAAGFGILAAILLLIAGRRRRRGGDDGDDG